MTDKGWVKIHRQILDWEWYSNPIISRLFFHLLIKANHTEKQWQGVGIVRGSFITSYPILAQETGFSVMQVRTALTKLKSTGEITVKTTSKYSVISINKYDDYQTDNRQVDSPVTDKQQASNRQVTTTKNEKNEKNEKNTTNVVGVTPKHWGNKLVGELIEYTKEKFNLPALSGTDKMNRNYAWNTLMKFREPEESKPTDYSLGVLKQIIDVGSGNKYWRSRISSMQKLHANVMDIALEMRKEVRNK